VLQYEFEESIGYWVVTASRAIERALNDELRPLGITLRQFQALAWLALEGDLCQSDLAAHMGVEAPTLAGILERMERDGWITRTTAPSDRRKKLVAPTEAVLPLWDQMAQCARRVRARATRGIDPARLRDVMTTLEKIRENLTPEEARR